MGIVLESIDAYGTDRNEISLGATGGFLSGENLI
jgi:hypothetical protein